MAELLKTSKFSENLSEKVNVTERTHSTATNTDSCCPFSGYSTAPPLPHPWYQFFDSIKPNFLHLPPLFHHHPPHCDFCMPDGRSPAATNAHYACQTGGITCTGAGHNCFAGFNNNAFAGNYGCAPNFLPPQLTSATTSIPYPVYIPVYVPFPESAPKSSPVQHEDKACQTTPIEHCENCQDTTETLSVISYLSGHPENGDTAIKLCEDPESNAKINTIFYSEKNDQIKEMYNYEVNKDESPNYPDSSDLYLQMPQSPPDHDSHKNMEKINDKFRKMIPKQVDLQSNVSHSADDLRFYSATSMQTVKTNPPFNPQMLMNQLLTPSETRSRDFNSDRLDMDETFIQIDTDVLDSHQVDITEDEDYDQTFVPDDIPQSFPRLLPPNRDGNMMSHDKNAALMMLSLLTSQSDSQGLRKVLDDLIVSTPQVEIEKKSPIENISHQSIQDDSVLVANGRFQQRPRLRKRPGSHSNSYKHLVNQNSNNSLSFN